MPTTRLINGCARNTTENRGWLLVEDAKKDADAVIDRMKDSLYFTQPQAAPK